MKPFSADELKRIDRFLHLNEFGDSAEIIEIHKSGEKSKRDMNVRKSANARRRKDVERVMEWRAKKPARYRRYMKTLMRARALAVKHSSASEGNSVTKSSPSVRHSSASSSSQLTRKA